MHHNCSVTLTSGAPVGIFVLIISYLDGPHWVSEACAGYSTKQVIMTLPAVFVAGIGSAMAIPAFQEVRSNSQEASVRNNLRQISTAADQHFLETRSSEVHIDQLTSEGGYIHALTPVAGESYEGMLIRLGELVKVALGDGTAITLEF